MNKKRHPPIEPQPDGDLLATVRNSTQQIWLAGLGAFSKAQAEGGKVFEALMKEGKSLEARTREITERGLPGLSQGVASATEQATTKAAATWDKLEQIFQDRVARSLSTLGVPTNKEMRALIRRVDELAAALQALRARQSGAGKPGDPAPSTPSTPATPSTRTNPTNRMTRTTRTARTTSTTPTKKRGTSKRIKPPAAHD